MSVALNLSAKKRQLHPNSTSSTWYLKQICPFPVASLNLSDKKHHLVILKQLSELMY